jgi:hypothetical protein
MGGRRVVTSAKRAQEASAFRHGEEGGLLLLVFHRA